MRRSSSLTPLLVVSLVSLLVTMAVSQVTLPPGYDSGIPPGLAATPTRTTIVRTSLSIQEVTDINEIRRSATLIYYFDMAWIDERLKSLNLAGPVIENPPASNVWLPDMMVVNGDQSQDFITLEIYPSGEVRLLTRSFSVIRLEFEYTDYPVDVQDMVIQMASFRFPSSILDFDTVTPVVGLPRSLGPHLFLQGTDPYFTYSPVTIEVEVDEFGFSIASWSFVATRVNLFHIVNNVVPLAFLTCMSFVSFFIDPIKPSAVKMNAGVIAALVSFLIAIFLNLPPTSYWTRMATFIIVSFSTAFLSFMVMLWAHKQAYKISGKGSVIKGADKGGKEKDKGKDDKKPKPFEDDSSDEDNNYVEMAELVAYDVEQRVNWKKIFRSMYQARNYLTMREKRAFRKFIERFCNWYKWIGMSLYLFLVVLIFALPPSNSREGTDAAGTAAYGTLAPYNAPFTETASPTPTTTPTPSPAPTPTPTA